jgi:hypothetical protein
MPPYFHFDDLDLREEPARGAVRTPLLGSSGFTDTCTATARCTKICCTCNPGLE